MSQFTATPSEVSIWLPQKWRNKQTARLKNVYLEFHKMLPIKQNKFKIQIVQNSSNPHWISICDPTGHHSSRHDEEPSARLRFRRTSKGLEKGKPAGNLHMLGVKTMVFLLECSLCFLLIRWNTGWTTSVSLGAIPSKVGAFQTFLRRLRAPSLCVRGGSPRTCWRKTSCYGLW